jgi:hypothetical protein
MASKLNEIEELINFLPKRDEQIANKLLDTRQWVQLRDIVISDIYLAEKHQKLEEKDEWSEIQVDSLYELKFLIEDYIISIYGSLEDYETELI